MAWGKGLSQDDLQKRSEQKNYTSNKRTVRPYLKGGLMKFYIPRDGDNLIRIVPPIEIEDMGSWDFDVPTHFSVGVQEALDGTPEKELFGNYICNAEMANVLSRIYGPEVVKETRCYRCQERIRIWTLDNETAKTYFPKTRKLVFVLDLLSDDKEELYIWAGPPSFINDIVSKSSNKETGAWKDISDPVEGVPVSFEKSGTGLLTKYSNLQIFSKPSPLTEKIDKQRVHMREFLILSTFDEMRLAHISEVQGNLDGHDTSVITRSKTPASTSETAEEDDIPFQEENPKCFGKDYGAYDNCDDGCTVADSCKIERRKSKSQEKAEPEDNPTNDAASAIKNRIKDAIKRNGNG